MGVIIIENVALKLNVRNQIISTAVSRIVSDSVNVVKAVFTFDSYWDGYIKTAVFSNGEVKKEVLLETDSVTVPWECLVTGRLKISVVGVIENPYSRITTKEMGTGISVVQCGDLTGDNAAEPTATVVEQLATKIDSANTNADTALNVANNLQNTISSSVTTATEQATIAANKATEALASASSASGSETNALEGANTATQAATTATTQASTATAQATLAQTAADTATEKATEISFSAAKIDAALPKTDFTGANILSKMAVAGSILPIANGGTGETALTHFFKEKGILSGVDLNAYTETGIYKLNGSITNKPSAAANYGLLFVTAQTGYVSQIYYPTVDGYQYIWKRISATTGSAWSTWGRLVEYTEYNTQITNIELALTEIYERLTALEA